MDSVASALMVSCLMTTGVGTADLFVQQNVNRNGFLFFFLRPVVFGSCTHLHLKGYIIFPLFSKAFEQHGRIVTGKISLQYQLPKLVRPLKCHENVLLLTTT